MNDLTRDLLDDDQPIPLGRPAAPVAVPAPGPEETPAVGMPPTTSVWEGDVEPLFAPAAFVVEPEVEPAVDQPLAGLVLDADVEPPLTPMPVAVMAEPEVEPAMTSTTPAAVANSAASPVGPWPPAGPLAQPNIHPLHGLRGFRLEPIAVEPVFDWRRDGLRFLVHYALVMAFVYALIVAFVLLIAHARGSAA